MTKKTLKCVETSVHRYRTSATSTGLDHKSPRVREVYYRTSKQVFGAVVMQFAVVMDGTMGLFCVEYCRYSCNIGDFLVAGFSGND